MSLAKRFLNNTKALSFVSALLYLYIYRSIYINYLVPVMGYMGYEANYTSRHEILICDLMIILPILFYKAYVKISDFFSILVYIFMYVPSMVALQYFYGCGKYLNYMLIFMFAMILFFKASSNKISNTKYLNGVGKLDLKWFIAFGFFCALSLLIIFRNNLHLVSFADVYDLREDNSEFAKGFALAGYFQMWCQGLFSPLLIAVGLYKKNRKLVLLGFLMSLLIYTAVALKSSIISPFVVLGFYYLMKNFMENSIRLFFPFFTVIICILYISSFFFEGDVAQMAYSVVFMRSIGVSAQLAPCYITVFDTHPFTYFTHISIIGKLFGGYPFSNPSLGNAVWEAYTGEDVMNANANFWLTDGVAAAGVLGVIIVSVLFYLILVYLNKLSNSHNQNVIFAMFIPVAMTFTNASLFTTLLSGGLIIAMVIMRYCRLELNLSKTN